MGGRDTRAFSQIKSFKLNFTSKIFFKKATTANPPGPPLGTLGPAALQVLINELVSQKGDHCGADIDQGQPVCLPAIVWGVVN